MKTTEFIEPYCGNCIHFTCVQDGRLLGICLRKKCFRYWFESCYYQINKEKDK